MKFSPFFFCSHSDKKKQNKQNLFYKEKGFPQLVSVLSGPLSHLCDVIFSHEALIGAKHRNFNSFLSPTPVSILETYGQIYS